LTIRWWRNQIEFSIIPPLSNYFEVWRKQEDVRQLVVDDEDTSKEANGTT
jgi:hypothetical protein